MNCEGGKTDGKQNQREEVESAYQFTVLRGILDNNGSFYLWQQKGTAVPRLK